MIGSRQNTLLFCALREHSGISVKVVQGQDRLLEVSEYWASTGELVAEPPHFNPEERVNSGLALGRSEQWGLKLLWTSELCFNKIFQVAKSNPKIA